jgi:hypothetical protein
MVFQKRSVWMAVAGVVLCGSALTQPLSAANNQSLESEIAALRADMQSMQQSRDSEVAALRSEVLTLRRELGNDTLTQQRADEIRGLVQDVLADADTRSSLADNGMTAGYNKGFFLASADGNFKLVLHGSLQVNFFWNYQSDSPTDDYRYGFQNKRTNLWFSGHVVDPSWTYHIKLIAFAGGGVGGGVWQNVDAWIRKDFGNGWYVRGGQFRLPFAEDMLTSYHNTLTIDRSEVNYSLGVGRSQGIEVGYRNDNMWFRGAFSDGKQSPRATPDAWFAKDTEYAFTGRLDVLFAGTWAQMEYDTSFRGEEHGFRAGGAFHFQDGEYGDAGDETELLAFTVDAEAKFDGANIKGAFFYESTESMTVDRDRLAFFLQGGVFVTDNLEVYGRYQWGDPDTTGADDLSVITVGFNRYFAKNKLKLTADISYGLESIDPSWLLAIHGLRADTAGEDGQVAIRTQVQLIF